MDNETQLFKLRVIGVEQMEAAGTILRPYDEEFELSAEHPADALDKLTHEVEWGILDSYAGFTVYVQPSHRPSDDA